MNDIKKQLYELNEEFYKLLSRLNANAKALITEENKKVFAENIIAVYKGELEKLMLEYRAEQAPALYRLKSIAEEMKPRRGLFRRNRAMKVIDEQLGAILEEHFEKLSDNLNASGQLPANIPGETPSEVAEAPEGQLPEEEHVETTSAPPEPLEPATEPPDEQPKENKNARRNRKPKRNAETPAAEPLPLQEVSTDLGAQMCLTIP